MAEKHFCTHCKGKRNHKLLFEQKKSGSENDYNFQWIEKYCIIECLGCEHISFLKIYGDNFMMRAVGETDYEYYEEETIFPPHLKEGHLVNISHLPLPIREIYLETINALKVQAEILAAGGFRAIIESACNYLKIKKGSLENRINLLKEKGYITLNESKRLHSIRFLGNDALHEIEKPKDSQLYLLLGIVNHLLSNLFINDKIIKGKIDIVVDNYEEFIGLLQRSITKEMLNQEITLDLILGKAKRLISKDDLTKFHQRLNQEINEGRHIYLEISSINASTYKILKKPELNFALS